MNMGPHESDLYNDRKNHPRRGKYRDRINNPRWEKATPSPLSKAESAKATFSLCSRIQSDEHSLAEAAVCSRLSLAWDIAFPFCVLRVFSGPSYPPNSIAGCSLSAPNLRGNAFNETVKPM